MLVFSDTFTSAILDYKVAAIHSTRYRKKADFDPLSRGHTRDACRLHAGCMQPAYDRRRPACRRRRRDDRNNTPWMNMSILVVFLRSYFSIFSHDVIRHAHSTWRRSSHPLPNTNDRISLITSDNALRCCFVFNYCTCRLLQLFQPENFLRCLSPFIKSMCNKTQRNAYLLTAHMRVVTAFMHCI